MHGQPKVKKQLAHNAPKACACQDVRNEQANRNCTAKSQDRANVDKDIDHCKAWYAQHCSRGHLIAEERLDCRFLRIQKEEGNVRVLVVGANDTLNVRLAPVIVTQQEAPLVVTGAAGLPCQWLATHQYRRPEANAHGKDDDCEDLDQPGPLRCIRRTAELEVLASKGQHPLDEVAKEGPHQPGGRGQDCKQSQLPQLEAGLLVWELDEA
mmetsp:Transcript_143169/g.356784  ORF Transcript_143169/g.356784 Transcript_143169/m.356784 type:complete len:210 (-) Transcript_143169:1428-2057(-)